MLFRYVALIVCALVAAYAVHKYHRSRGVELDQRHAKHHGWESFRLHVGQDVWACPLCGALMASWRDVQTHRFHTSSPCAQHQDNLAATATAAELERAGKDAESAGRWSVSATVTESNSGAVDTWVVDAPEPRGELEGADNGDA